MSKHYCDLCGREFFIDGSYGGLVRVGKKMQFGEKAQPIISPQRDVLDVCQNCADKIWEFAQKIKDNDGN